MNVFATTRAGDAEAPRESHLRRLPQRIHALRVMGMALGGLPLLVVLHQLGAGAAAWGWALLGCVLWPQLARLHSRCSRDPFRAELRNLVADSFFAGTCAPLMHFNVLPSVVLVAVASADKMNTGIRGLWWRALLWLLAGVAGMGLLTGFAVRPVSDMAVVLACLPILVVHTLVVSLISYRLVRRVQRQNRRLRELAHTDPLTGLPSRRHWEQAVQALLARPQPATLLLLDLDAFKVINDSHGHTVGDDVLRCLGDIVRTHAATAAVAGRLGGDEIAVVVAQQGAAALAIAEALRTAVASLVIPQAPSMRCTVSIGLAARTPATVDVRSWIDAADRALYRAKHEGRNRIDHDAASGADTAPVVLP